jgi:hypothetical protein
MPPLIVCTSKQVCLAGVGPQRTLLKGNGTYAGLTWDRDRFYIAERAHTGPDKCPEEAIRYYEPRNGGLVNRGVIGLGDLHDVHDIYWRLDDEILYVMESGTNRIRTMGSPVTRDASRPHLSAISWGQVIGSPADEWMMDINHINSFWSENGKFYIVENNHGPSRVVITNEAFSIIDAIDIGAEAHNVAVRGNHIVVCSSREGRIYIYDILRRRLAKSKQIVKGWYPRGMAMTHEHIWVGLTSTDGGPSKIICMDPDLRTEYEIPLEGAEQITCLRLLSKDDRAHNRAAPPEGL